MESKLKFTFFWEIFHGMFRDAPHKLDRKKKQGGDEYDVTAGGAENRDNFDSPEKRDSPAAERASPSAGCRKEGFPRAADKRSAEAPGVPAAGSVGGLRKHFRAAGGGETAAPGEDGGIQ